MLQGIFPVIPTLFTDQDHVDPIGLRQVVRFALNAGAHGVVFPGVASEYNYLTLEERGELMSVVFDEVAGRIPIIAGASAPTSQEAVAAGSHAREHGIRHLMVMAPAGFQQDLDKHQEFFGDITRELDDVEIILQNAPPPVGAGLSPADVIKVAASNTSITYAKEETLPSGPAISEIRQAKLPHLQGVFGGGGARYIIDELNRGAIGALPAVELTDLHVAIYNSHCNGEFERARELYQRSLPLLAAQMIYRMRLTKYVLQRRGTIGDQIEVRAPLPHLDSFAQQDLDTMLSDLQSTFDELK